MSIEFSSGRLSLSCSNYHSARQHTNRIEAIPPLFQRSLAPRSLMFTERKSIAAFSRGSAFPVAFRYSPAGGLERGFSGSDGLHRSERPFFSEKNLRRSA